MTLHAASQQVATRAQRILEYWFGTLDDDALLDQGAHPFSICYQRWYGKSEAIDQEIRGLFHRDLEEVTQGARWDSTVQLWSNVPKGLLALVILLDQLPRNMFRGRAQMYRYDALGLVAATLADREYEGVKLALVERMFLLVPLMHAEDLTLQDTMVERFEELLRIARTRSPHNESFFAFACTYARRHRDVVLEFGRFPHRNEILSRTSTRAELAYLESSDAGF